MHDCVSALLNVIDNGDIDGADKDVRAWSIGMKILIGSVDTYGKKPVFSYLQVKNKNKNEKT